MAGRKSANLRTRFHRTLKKLGITPWPKLFQNLRSSRETELAEQFPLHEVCEWIGNTPDVARDHYLQLRDDDFLIASGLTRVGQARRVVPKSGPASARMEQQAAAPLFGESRATPTFAATNENMPAGAGMCGNGGMGAEGFEPSKT